MGQNGPNQSPNGGDSDEVQECFQDPLSTRLRGLHSGYPQLKLYTPGQLQRAGLREYRVSEAKPPEAPTTPTLPDLPADPVHQARQVLAGIIAIAAGLWDAWIIGNTHGFDISFDTVMVLTGLYLISGAPGLIPTSRNTPPKPEAKP